MIFPWTTLRRKTAAAADRVNRQFVAERPNQLWCADFSCVSTWQSFAYGAFIIAEYTIMLTTRQRYIGMQDFRTTPW